MGHRQQGCLPRGALASEQSAARQREGAGVRIAIPTLQSALQSALLSVVIPILCLGYGLFATPKVAAAQPKSQSLFSRAAAAKADEQHRRRRSSSNRIEHEGSFYDFQPDTAEGILWSSRNNASEFFGDYRGLNYIGAVRGAVFGRDDELERASFAQRLLLYQSVKSLTEHLKNTPLDTYYRRVIGSLKEVRERTTVQVVRDNDGELGVEQGEDEESTVLKLKFHASMRDGVEPRLYIGKNFTLRFDPLKQDTLLEFRHDF